MPRARKNSKIHEDLNAKLSSMKANEYVLVIACYKPRTLTRFLAYLKLKGIKPFHVVKPQRSIWILVIPRKARELAKQDFTEKLYYDRDSKAKLID